MYSELFRIPIELFGVPLFGVGVLLAFWLLACVAWGAAHFRSGAGLLEWAVLVAVTLIVAAVLVLLPRMFPEGLPVRSYGLMMLLGGLAGVGLATRRAMQNGLHPDVIFSLAIRLFVAGILGARLFFVIEYWEERFGQLPLREALVQALMFTEGGLVVYGSLIGASLAFLVFCRRHNLPILAMADILAASLVIGLALGRIGCLFNGCCYGGPTNVAWAITFPAGSPAYGDHVGQERIAGVQLWQEPGDPEKRIKLYSRSEEGETTLGVVSSIDGKPVSTLVEAQAALTRAYWSGEEAVEFTLADGSHRTAVSRSLPVHPTQLYSALNAVLLSWLCWAFYAFRRRDGEVIGLLLALYPISRLLLETIRTDESDFLGTSLSISQNVSIVLLLLVAVYWAWLVRQPRGFALADSMRRG
ncbi:MAG: prolipoprotein diacylglyceryl transferase [Planctomycetales bacterium]|nr:prolipoprotein diacylglyceryl transferase [Planctomycetales bacterium]